MTVNTLTIEGVCMQVRDFLYEGVKSISKQQALDRGYFGPVYHGTSAENRERIAAQGFKITRGATGSDGVSNGYQMGIYVGGQTGYPPPIHHLGYGVYFTTAKSIAKQFNNDSVSGLVEYYLNVPNLEEINFGSPNTMMQWWVANGYTMPDNWAQMPAMQAQKAWEQGTAKLTRTLKSQFDAVWYKGKGLYKLLDGDQVCIYRTSGIFVIDPKKSKPMDVGSKVTYVPGKEVLNTHGDPMFPTPDPKVKGVIIDKRPIPERSREHFTFGPKAKNWITVKWTKGGTGHNYTEENLAPVK